MDWNLSTFGSIKNWRLKSPVVFVLCLLPLIAILGSALDLNRQQQYQGEIKAALNVAAVSTARYALSTDTSDQELSRVAEGFFRAEIDQHARKNLNQVELRREGDLVRLEVSGSMPTTALHFVGERVLPLSANAGATFGKEATAEIALVLDTSYSMQGARMSALQAAANDMIDSLVARPDNNVKMSIIPFASYVNVGTDKLGEPWLLVEPERSGTIENCSVESSWYETYCKLERYDCIRDGVASTCKRWSCLPGDLENAPRRCEIETWRQSWHGCVKSRRRPHRVSDAFYSSDPIIGFVTHDAQICPNPIQALTADPDILRQAVNDLQADQNTYIPTGLIWGLRTLSSSGPFDEAEPYADALSRSGRKALVLMSDGANTRSPDASGRHSGDNRKEADRITRQICESIKAEGIELYTIAFELDDLKTKKMLRKCATEPDYYFEAKNAKTLSFAFRTIGENFSNVSLAF